MSFQFIVSCLYFFLPAYFGNMAPPLAREAGIFKFLDKPIDGGKKFMGQPLFGSHKTWRGAIFYVIVGTAIVYIQYFLYRFPQARDISIINYSEINLLLFALLFSSGSVFGDILFAFVKRRLKFEPGRRFIPFDQTNYVIGSFLFLSPFFKIDFIIWALLFALTFFLHVIFNYTGYLIGLQPNKW